MTVQELAIVAPFVAAILTAIAILLVDLAWPNRSALAVATALIGLAITAWLVILVGGSGTQVAFGGTYVVDDLTTFLQLLLIGVVALSIVFGPDYLAPRNLPTAEFATVLVFALTGAMLIAGARDLLILFIALELMVLPGYMLAAYAKRDAYSTEGAIKYFLLGSFSSAIFLFGLAFVWGFTGTTSIAEIAEALSAIVAGSSELSPGLVMGLALLTTGVAFKIAAVPFHYWTPDAYQGSPTPVTGYLSVGPKVAAFALILRLFVDGLYPLAEWWLPVVHRALAADDDARQPRRADPGQHQAHARLQLDRAHRLHPGRAGGVRARRASRQAASKGSSSTASPTRS